MWGDPLSRRTSVGVTYDKHEDIIKAHARVIAIHKEQTAYIGLHSACSCCGFHVQNGSYRRDWLRVLICRKRDTEE